ncbi:3-oxoacyl-[acyl-carrier-protein] reductase [Mechercharimyces sp. CAU 1602]|uniref:3-oxoacyl-[acyl-carrier-protein] reductase n=1 Tax=Mechercharimyces sp. CAU 1602 TaxID=2973933 RepID=UPI0021625CFB|nr:3-oxoacyl-[acyl-carrier-protein] reductase [Mechercharimyces sp. CAU 1602]MCS1351364.1 3-oxoacyl-[acyl-carrier-protein] reductase [Mechercharimyces sp. CAU 1602]
MLQGKKAIVTGGSRGIGKAIALALARAGADVAIVYAGNHEAAEQTVKQIRETGQEGISLQANVAEAHEVTAAVKQVHDHFGRIDVLVNNAGITKDNLLLRLKEDEWDQVIDTNLKGAFLFTKAVMRPMIKQRSGRIINISSVVGVIGNPGQSNYVAAKSGMIGLTKATAKEVASRNITVNAIAPGFIETEMTAVLADEVRAGLLAQIPLQRLGCPEEVADVVLFFASDQARYITGQTLNVDGGMVTG